MVMMKKWSNYQERYWILSYLAVLALIHFITLQGQVTITPADKTGNVVGFTKKKKKKEKKKKDKNVTEDALP